MDPPMETYEGILQLIAEFAFGCDEWSHFDSEWFKVDDCTITRTGNRWRSAYGAEKIASGQRSWRVRIEKKRSEAHRNRVHMDKWFNGGDSGYAYSAVRRQFPRIVSVLWTFVLGLVAVLQYWGCVYGGKDSVVSDSGVTASDGDAITVELDADEWTVTFRKNVSETVGTVENIKRLVWKTTCGPEESPKQNLVNKGAYVSSP